MKDYYDSAGHAIGHYFHQDLIVAKYIYEDNPKRHLDVGSRFDGFVAHVASFREIDVIDIRPLHVTQHNNIKFTKTDLMDINDENITDSLSCLHAIEHFGLGRYSDRIDVNGHIKGIIKLISLLETGGIFYLSFPIGRQDEVHFNAHRILHPYSIFNIPEINNYMKLVQFDYVDDNGDLYCNSSIQDAINEEYGCGIYTFRKL